jgi:ferredoxin-NADP reductase
VLVAGGIGVTPMASILQELLRQRQAGRQSAVRKVYFYWMVRRAPAFFFFFFLTRSSEGMRCLRPYLTGRLGGSC